MTENANIAIRVVEGENGPRLTFDRSVEFVEIPYDSVPELVKELVLEYGRRRTGLTQQNLDATIGKISKPMMDPDEIGEWANTPELKDFEHYLKSAGFIQLPGRLASQSQYGEGYLTWRNGTLGEGKTILPWRPEMMQGLIELFGHHRDRYNGIVWRTCPSFEMREGLGRVLRMRFHFIHVTNT